jgi:hypothetical protein
MLTPTGQAPHMPFHLGPVQPPMDTPTPTASGGPVQAPPGFGPPPGLAQPASNMSAAQQLKDRLMKGQHCACCIMMLCAWSYSQPSCQQLASFGCPYGQVSSCIVIEHGLGSRRAPCLLCHADGACMLAHASDMLHMYEKIMFLEVKLHIIETTEVSHRSNSMH